MATDVLVLGDSIQWGQGLPPAQRIGALVAQRRRDAAGRAARVHVYAHSGADLAFDEHDQLRDVFARCPPKLGEAVVLAGRDGGPPARSPRSAVEREAVGEVPRPAPYIIQQVADAAADLDPREVGLVLVDGGINDTEVWNLVLPGKDPDAVAARGESVGPRLTVALERIVTHFPGARVVLTGYYPVVSEASDLGQLVQFLGAATRGLAAEVRDRLHDLLDGFFHRPAAPRFDAFTVRGPVEGVRDHLSARCARWLDATHGAMRLSVAAVARNGGRVAFAEPAFRPEHAIFAPGSLLWRCVGGHPDDARLEERRRYCHAHPVDALDRFLIEAAAVGHPNAAGAARYADAVLAALG